MRGQNETTERVIAEIASRQWGNATRKQLLKADVSRDAIQRRLDKGSLIRVHEGVYRVGHSAPSVEATYMAAVLACGEGAALSGRAAAHLLGLVRGSAPNPEVTARLGRVVKGVTTHHSRRLDPRDKTIWQGIPVTTPARTLVDLAAVLSEYELGRTIHEAGIRHNTTPADVEAALARKPNAKGAATLRAILRGDTKITLSKLERAFLKLLEEAGLPLPQTNRPAGGRFVDCRWPAHQLTVELDGYAFHSSRHAFEQDRHRERQAYARGDQFRRYTWGDVSERSRVVLRELRAVLVPV
jgi:very-short-patch-repair endonuclease